MLLIPEQVKALRDEINRLEDKKIEIENYFKECEKSTLDPGFVKYSDTTLEANEYNDVCKKLDSYKRALVENEFTDLKESTTIDCGSSFTILYNDTKEEETYTLVQNMIGLTRNNLGKDKNYISFDTYLGKAIIGKTRDEFFSYTFSLKGRRDSITITGKIIDILKKSDDNVHFIMSKSKSARIAKKSERNLSLAHKEDNDKELLKLKEITLSQFELLKEEQARLSYILGKLKKYENKIMLDSVISLEKSDGTIKKYRIVDKDVIDVKEEININSVIASRIIAKNIGDSIKEKYTYKEDGKIKGATYSGRLVKIDNSKVKEEGTVYSSIWSIYSRLGIVNKLLRESKIVETPCEDVIGIGSKVSIITYENASVQNRRVEIINQAVSTELNTDYVEVISPLGQEIIGLRNNQTFEYNYFSKLENKVLHGTGIVYDINNNMQEYLAKDPLTYQKKKRG